MMILILSIMMIQCKKTTTNPIPCSDVKTLEGKYVGRNSWQKDTITITFVNMSSDCKSIYTISNFVNGYNQTADAGNCSRLTKGDYQIVGTIIITTNSRISLSYNSLAIWGCLNNILTYNKIN
jgi:hypothetical protein